MATFTSIGMVIIRNWKRIIPISSGRLHRHFKCSLCQQGKCDTIGHVLDIYMTLNKQPGIEHVLDIYMALNKQPGIGHVLDIYMTLNEQPGIGHVLDTYMTLNKQPGIEHGARHLYGTE